MFLPRMKYIDIDTKITQNDIYWLQVSPCILVSEEYLVSLEGEDPGEMEGERDPPREVKPE